MRINLSTLLNGNSSTSEIICKTGKGMAIFMGGVNPNDLISDDYDDEDDYYDDYYDDEDDYDSRDVSLMANFLGV